VSFAVVSWKWKPALPSGPRYFDSSHVNVLRAMVARHLPIPHRFVCITDDTDGLDPRIEAVPMPPERFEDLVNPHQHKYDRARSWGEKKYFPSCYRRLWAFSEEAKVLAERILSLDVDVVVTGSLLPLVERDETFVGWCDERNEIPRVAGGAYLLKTGAHTDVWDDFDAANSPRDALEAGYSGSDQAWMSYKLRGIGGRWGRADGLTKITWLKGEPDETTRLVFTAGHSPPWSRDVQRRYGWLTNYWRS
jgi:hypothetical protein